MRRFLAALAFLVAVPACAQSVVPLNPPNPFPSTIAPSGNWQSGIIRVYGGGSLPALVVTVESTQAGAVSIQRYADAAGTIPVGGNISQTLTDSTEAYVGANDGVPYLSFQVTITNTGGSSATITDAAILAGTR